MCVHGVRLIFEEITKRLFCLTRTGYSVWSWSSHCFSDTFGYEWEVFKHGMCIWTRPKSTQASNSCERKVWKHSVQISKCQHTVNTKWPNFCTVCQKKTKNLHSELKNAECARNLPTFSSTNKTNVWCPLESAVLWSAGSAANTWNFQQIDFPKKTSTLTILHLIFFDKLI